MTDTSDAALPGVTVTVTSKQTGSVRTAVTDAAGAYVVTNLKPRKLKGIESRGMLMSWARSRSADRCSRIVVSERPGVSPPMLVPSRLSDPITSTFIGLGPHCSLIQRATK